MSKGQFDLSNVGGQPKGWTQREQEKQARPGLGFKGHLLLWGSGGLILITAGALLLGAFRLLGG